MTDRELLERAAAAAGIEILRCCLDDPMWNDMLLSDAMFTNGRRGWNPLADDGDRYRLARRLGLIIDFDGCEVRFYVGAEEVPRRFSWPKGDELEEARAIVRAAAAMPPKP